MSEEVLYPIRTIRQLVWEIQNGKTPLTINKVIEHIDVQRAWDKMPVQYRSAIQAWLDSVNDDTGPDWNLIVMELEEDEERCKRTVKAAWSYLYHLLNPKD